MVSPQKEMVSIEVMETLTKATEVIISQYMSVSNQHIHLKYTHYVSVISS